MISNTTKSFNNLAISWNILYNYFEGSIKLFSNLYIEKNILIKLTKQINKHGILMRANGIFGCDNQKFCLASPKAIVVGPFC